MDKGVLHRSLHAADDGDAKDAAAQLREMEREAAGPEELVAIRRVQGRGGRGEEVVLGPGTWEVGAGAGREGEGGRADGQGEARFWLLALRVPCTVAQRFPQAWCVQILVCGVVVCCGMPCRAVLFPAQG